MSESVTKSGWLFKRGGMQTSWKKRWCVLSAGVFKYYADEKDTKAKGTLELKNVSVGPCKSEKLRKLNAFEVATGGALATSWVLHNNNYQDMMDWVNALEQSVGMVTSKRGDDDVKSVSGIAGSAPAKGKVASTPGGSTATAASSQPAGLNLEPDDDFMHRAGVPERYSLWRKPLPLKGITNGLRKLAEPFEMDDNLQMQMASSLAIHDSINCFAIGSPCASVTGASIQIVRIDSHVRDGAECKVIRKLGGPLRKDTSTPSSSSSSSSIFGGVSSRSAPSSSSSQLSSASEAKERDRGGGDVTDMSWNDDRLLYSSTSGRVLLYKVHPDNASQYDIGTEASASYIHSKCNEAAPPLAPGRYPHDTRVKRVFANTADRKTFLSLANSDFYIWDMNRTQKALHIEAGSVLPLYAGAWNPQSASEFVIGGASKVLKILDVRILAKDPQKCVVWKAEKAHADTIRDVAWSPLVSHWVASAGDDGCARIWDVRYGSRPVRVLQLNTHTVSSVSWSRAHCEAILTGGVDGSLRLWNLRLSPHYLASTEDDFGSSVVGCGWSPEHPLQYIGVSAAGEASVIQLGREFVTTFVNNRSRTLEQEFRKVEDAKTAATAAAINDTNNANSAISLIDRGDRRELTMEQRDARSKTYEKMERNIERLLYLRDFDGAFKVICTLANDYWNDGRYELCSTLLKQTSPSRFTQLLAEDPKLQAKKPFSKLVGDLCRLFPPNTLKLTKVDPVSHAAIQFLKLRLALIKYMEAGKYRDILELEKEICSNLSRAGDAFDGPTLERMIIVILAHDHLRALEFALHIAKTLKDGEFFKNFVPVATMLFSPTIYDRMADDDAIPGTPTTITAANTTATGSGGASSSSSSIAANGTTIVAGSVVRSASSQSVSRRGAAADDDDLDSDSDDDDDDRSRVGSRAGDRKMTVTSGAPSTPAAARGGINTAIGASTPSASAAKIAPGTPAATTSAITGTPSSSVAATGARAVVSSSTSSGRSDGDATHLKSAQITLERDLRNPKIVISQLQLLLQLLTCVADGELAELRAEANGTTSSVSAKKVPIAAKAAAKKAQDSDDDELEDSDDDTPSSSSSSSAKKAVASAGVGIAAAIAEVRNDDNNTSGVPATPRLIGAAHAAAISANTSSSSLSSSGGNNNGGTIQATNPYRRWAGFTSVTNGIAPSMGAFNYALPAISASAARRILQLMEEEKEHRKLLPAIIHRVYMHALVQQKTFDKLFILGTKMVVNVVKPYPFSKGLIAIMDDAVPKFAKFLDKYLTKDTSRAWETVRLQAAALTLINILYNTEYLPKKLKDTIPQYMTAVTKELRLALTEMIRSSDYKPQSSPPSGRVDAKERAEHILQQIGRIRENKRSDQVFFEDLISAFASMLQTFRSTS